jgi:hypothetical protein
MVIGSLKTISYIYLYGKDSSNNAGNLASNPAGYSKE